MKHHSDAGLQSHPGNSPIAIVNRCLERFAHSVSVWAGGNWAFAIAFFLVLAWLVTGPLFGYSDTWQLAINTSTTIVTFLMVFLIQRAQNKEGRATQLKLNELVAALEGASNRLIGVENLSEEELQVLARHYQVLIDRVKRDGKITQSHSIDEAERRHEEKHEKARAHLRRSESSRE